MSGNLTSGVARTIAGGTFFNEFAQYFMPGAILTFQLSLTSNPQTSAIPDEFSFQLIDKTGTQISTTDPTGSNSLIVIDLIGSSLVPQVYSTTRDGVTITPMLAGTTVPEPASAWLVIAVLGGMGFCVPFRSPTSPLI
jgi:hypothetical protein